ncbi:endochitinase 1 [Podospora fimiseda]|uniref:chitinase n=1 Tax=Podospora fimiseda TaxID=252190 RepID=A0AAN7BY24_9PEZI|nr:endochitinase 1 [Podospora fimiseda]
MLSSLLVLVAPLLLANPVSAAPQLIELGAQDTVEVLCNAVVAQTVTKTVYATFPATRSSSSTTTRASSSSSSAARLLASSSSTSRSQTTSAPSSNSARLSTTSSSTSRTLGTPPVPSVSTTYNNTTGAPFSNSTSGAGLRSAIYFTNWGIYGADYQPDQLPVENLTHILYAFADIAPDGEVISSDPYADLEKRFPTDSWNETSSSSLNAYGCIKQLYLLKQKHRHLKTLLSIGGWTFSSKFPSIASTESGRRKFCSSAINLMKDWGFDGLDIDWEYPSSAKEASDLVLLLRTCRHALDSYAASYAAGYRFLITIATSAGAMNYNKLDFKGMDAYIDAWHLMAYDFSGGWDFTTGHQSNLMMNPGNINSTKFSADQAVGDYIKNGVAPRKIVLGVPLYGRIFENTNGIGLPFEGIGQGTASYKELPLNGAEEKWDEVAMASYSYDERKKELVSYDNVRSVGVKSRYILEKGLGGVVYWEGSGDKSGSESLVGVVAGELRKGKGKRVLEGGGENNLRYPVSRYVNIRNGMV